MEGLGNLAGCGGGGEGEDAHVHEYEHEHEHDQDDERERDYAGVMKRWVWVLIAVVGCSDDVAADTDAGVDAAPDERYPLDGVLRLDHVQLRGTHNSYHQQSAAVLDPTYAYSQAPLETQLEAQGVRAFELDVHKNPEGAIEVYHLSDFDPGTSCLAFVDCLGALRSWSHAHPDHVPLVVWIEVKDTGGGSILLDLAPVDAAIREVFDASELLTPDDLAAGHDSPRARVEAEGWPTLGEVRGKLLFVLLNADRAELYTDGFVGLAGKPMFAAAPVDRYADGWAVVTKVNDPTLATEIRAALDAHMLVASNTCGAGTADAECQAALDAALDNGPHTLHDDFPAKVDGHEYFLEFPDSTVARCNPITAPAECTPEAIE